MNEFRHQRVMLVLAMLLLAPPALRAEQVAITYDDLPLNGTLPADVTRQDIVKKVLAELQQAGVPQSR
jgi:hypothetical protein